MTFYTPQEPQWVICPHCGAHLQITVPKKQDTDFPHVCSFCGQRMTITVIDGQAEASK